MSSTLDQIERLQTQIAGQREFIESAMQRSLDENRDLSDVEQANVDQAHADVERHAADLKRLTDFHNSVTAAEALSPLKTSRSVFRTEARPEAPKSFGELFTDSEQFRSYDGRGTSGSVELPGYGWETRAVGPDPLLTTTKPGSDLLPTPYKGYGPEHFMDFPLLSMAGHIPVSGNSVQWVTTTDSSGVDKVAEGAAKPPVAWTTNVASYTLQNYAGWFKFSRASIEDIPQLRSIIDIKLRRALDVKLASEAAAALLAGFSGANTSTGAAGAKMLDQIRNGIATIQGRGINPQAILVNPADQASMDIAVMGSTLLGPVMRPSLWGLPIYAVNEVPAKTAIIGNISEGLTWFSRNGVQMYVTDSDVSDGAAGAVTSDFRHNLLTALIEQRGIFAVTDSQVLQKVTIP